MARRCLKCDAPICPRPEGDPKGVAYAEADGTPLMLTVMYECGCGSHQSAILWECEELAAESFRDARETEAFERELAPATRGFFSVTDEIASRGL